MSFSNWTLCFHKGGGGSVAQNLMSAWIKVWTHSPFSHVELYDPHTGLCFSASGYEGKVRFQRIMFSHPERWAFLSLPDKEIPINIRQTMAALDGKPYDRLGAVFCGSPWERRVEDDRAWYCFEVVSKVLRWAPFQKNGRELYDCARARGAWKATA